MSRRLTVPEGQTSLVLPEQLASELRSLLAIIRRGQPLPPATRTAARGIAGDVLLAMLDSGTAVMARRR